MIKLEDISTPVTDELISYEEYLRGVLSSDGELATALLNHILTARGKGIRPLLTLLTAKLNPENIDSARLSVAAMMVEMIHTASLVHDDVVDGASVRRSRPSVNAMWDSRSAVLIGDYILSRTLVAGIDSGAYDIVSYITKTVDQICQGELLQSEQCTKLSMTRKLYNDIIYRKTASLISASCVVGAMARNASTQEIEQIKEYGYNLGMAFQIKDDILDYTGTNGDKQRYIDIRERKITLPLLTILEQANAERRTELISMLSHLGESDITSLAEAVVVGKGLEASQKIMYSYIDKAKEALADYPSSPAKESLISLCDFVANRQK